MVVRFAMSALRHGISRERSRYVVSHCTCPLFGLDPTDIDLVAYLGTDRNGIALEVFGIDLEHGEVLVIHAMKLRARYRNDYSRVIECENG